MSVLYTRAPRLFADLAIAHGDPRYARLLRSLARVKLLILDDWDPKRSRPIKRDLEIIEDRYDKGSIIITSQVPVDRSHDLIGVPTHRRHPRPRHSQRLPHRSGRREPAQATVLVLKSTCARRPARPILGATRPQIMAGSATAQWKARSAHRYHATRVLADIQIQARLTNGSGQNIIPSIRGSRRRVADIKPESRPASNRNQWPASYWNAWPASSESALTCLLRLKAYGAYPAGAAFSAGRTTR